MAGVTFFINVKVAGSSRSVPAYSENGLIDVPIWNYFASVGRAALSRTPLSNRLAGILPVIEACRKRQGSQDPLKRPSWTNELPGLLELARRDASARALVLRAWDFLNDLAESGALPRASLNEFVGSKPVPIASRLARPNDLTPLGQNGLPRSRRPTLSPFGRTSTARPEAKRPVVAFPDSSLGPFFLEGLRRPSEMTRTPARSADERLARDYNLCGLLCFLPMAFAALRLSEPLHLYCSDVSYDFEHGTGARVVICDPEGGRAPPRPDGSERNRTEYLREEFGLRPRNCGTGNQHAGWKDLALDRTSREHGRHTLVYWLVPEAGALFWRVSRAYLACVRPPSCRHPFLLTSHSNNALGTPWTIDAAKHAFAMALKRIGAGPDASLGYCPHGFRHRGKVWMDAAGIPAKHQQQVFHQKSPASQFAYGRVGSAEINDTLAAVVAGLTQDNVGDRHKEEQRLNSVRSLLDTCRSLNNYFRENYSVVV